MSGKGINILFENSYKDVYKVFIIIIQLTIISTPGILAVYLYNKYIESLPMYINCIGTLVISSILFYIIYSIVLIFNSKKYKGNNEYEIFLSVLTKTIYIFLILIVLTVLVSICILLFKKEIKEYFTSIVVVVSVIILLCILYFQNKRIIDCETLLKLYSDKILRIEETIEQK